jgi:multiple sugar transport system ATP-binding protein
VAEVELKGVTKRYDGDVLAVDNVDLKIDEGQFMVLVGPSGCGKSTTLRMVAGLEKITDGTVSIKGRVVNDVPPKDRDVAMVFQSYALYPHMTVFDNMAFGLKLRRTPRDVIVERVHGVAAMLELTELLERKPKALSGGQRQRVAMGRAIVREPEVFLFDEPLSNLDARLRLQMRMEISQLHKRLGATMIYVTHDQVEAMTLADQLAVMADGRVQQVGTPMDIYEAPRNRFVAGFIGSPGMNFVENVRMDPEGLILNAGVLPVGDELVSRLSSGVFTLGVRPEHVRPVSRADAHGVGKVVHVDFLGADAFAHVTFEGGDITMRLSGEQRPRHGDEVPFQFQLDKLHLFGEDDSNVSCAIGEAS